MTRAALVQPFGVGFLLQVLGTLHLGFGSNLIKFPILVIVKFYYIKVESNSVFLVLISQESFAD